MNSCTRTHCYGVYHKQRRQNVQLGHDDQIVTLHSNTSLLNLQISLEDAKHTANTITGPNVKPDLLSTCNNAQ